MSAPTAPYAAWMQDNDFDLLDRAIAGRVIRPESPEFDAVRRTFNGMIDRRPAAVAVCQTTSDVVAAVRAAVAAGLPVSVRGGAHSVAGHAVGAGALVIDLREMRSVTVDVPARRARAAGGALWEDLDGATVAHGLATTGGTFVDTGIGGLTLSGGIGFLMGTAGLTCDNLLRAEVVTADGSVVIAGEDGDPELLWALRGGGGNFGVVTEFEYGLHALGPLHVGRFAVPLAEAAAGLRAAAALAREAPRELVLFVVGPTTRERPVDGIEAGPSDHVRIAAIYQGSLDDARAVVTPLTTIPGVSGDLVAMTYPELQASSGILPFGLRHYGKGHFLRDLEGAAIDAVVDGMGVAGAAHSFMLMEAMTGKARVEPSGGAAFGQREARWNVTALGIWEDPKDDAVQIAWARRVADALSPLSLTGAGYGNYAPADETAARVQASFGAERFARLRAVKRRYDPTNVFRFNHNIPPAD